MFTTRFDLKFCLPPPRGNGHLEVVLATWTGSRHVDIWMDMAMDMWIDMWIDMWMDMWMDIWIDMWIDM